MAWQTLVFSLALIPVCIAPAFLQRAGFVDSARALVLSSGFFYAARVTCSRSNTIARRLFLASIVYPRLTFGLMIFGKALL